MLLDEPTAQLDVRGEAEVFERLLAATRGCTTILISHRFSTVRHADLICVVEAGRVVELGSHDELMAAGGRYRTMFELQASRFGDEDGDRTSRLEPLERARRLMRVPHRSPTTPTSRRCLARCGRSLRLAYEAEPRLLVASFTLMTAVVAARRLRRPVAKVLADAVEPTATTSAIRWAAAGLAAAAAAGWLLRTIGSRVEMRFRDRATIELEAHVAQPPGGRSRRSSTTSDRPTSTGSSCCASRSSSSTTSTRR